MRILEAIKQGTRANLKQSGPIRSDPDSAACVEEWRARITAILRMAKEELGDSEEGIGLPQEEEEWEYGMVRQIMIALGASPIEVLQFLLNMANPRARPGTLIDYLPKSIEVPTLRELMERFCIHPLSAARYLGNRRKALNFLRSLGLENDFGIFIGPGGRLLIKGNEQVRTLPPGLVLWGRDLISDCPSLEDLGQEMISFIGPLQIERCQNLAQLPDGFETYPMRAISIDGVPVIEDYPPALQVIVRECPNFVRLGVRTRIRGILRVIDSPGFLEDSHPGVDLIERSVTRHRCIRNACS